jgi:hypothetical protein
MDQFSVLDFHQAKSLGRSRGTGHGAGAGFENSDDVTRFQLASPDLHERANHVADHVVKKPIPGNLVDQHGCPGAAENSGSEYSSHHCCFDFVRSRLGTASTVPARRNSVFACTLETLFRSGPIDGREAREIVFPFK